MKPSQKWHKPLVPLSEPLAPPTPKLCICVHHSALHCLAQRHEVSLTFARLMNGCSCRCHRDVNGGAIPSGAWRQNRQRIAANSPAWRPEEVK